MLCHVEIISIDAVNCDYINERLATSRSGPIRFEPWIKSSKWAILRPEFSIIDITDLDWHSIAGIANMCAGSSILLWGTQNSICGLEYLRKDFSALDLSRHLNIRGRLGNRKEGDDRQGTEVYSYVAPATIPLAM